MGKMKTEFELERINWDNKSLGGGQLTIVGSRPDNKPYVSIQTKVTSAVFIKDSDLELLAINILKALKSKKLKQ